MTYRVFVGYWEHDPGREDVGGLSWEQARDKLIEHLVEFKDDDCPCCRAAGTEALLNVAKAKPGDFRAEVDGSDYLILEEADAGRDESLR